MLTDENKTSFLSVNPIILDLCSGTGSWSEPYRKAGYHVIRVTLPGSNIHTFEPPENVHGILAAPPCTAFSFAKRNPPATPGELLDAWRNVARCLDIIAECAANGSLRWWCLENPQGMLYNYLGKPAMVFRQWQYGDGFNKTTFLWGCFNAPLPTSLRPPNVPTVTNPPIVPNLSRQAVRSRTPSGFANAFFEVNR